MDENSSLTMVDEINRLIRSKTIKKIVFFDEQPGKDDIESNINGSIYKLLNIALYAFYLIYIKERMQRCKTDYLNERIRSSFDKLYRSHQYNDDLIFFILVELQIESTKTERHITNSLINNTFNIYYWKERIKFAKTSSRAIDTRSELLKSLRNTLLSIPLFQYMEIIERGDHSVDLVIDDLNNKLELEGSDLIKYNCEENEFYIASKIDFGQDECSIVYKKLGFEDSFLLPFIIGKKTPLRRIISVIFSDELKKKSNHDSLLLNKLYGDNFDRIRILALAISDAIDDNFSLKNRIVDKYNDNDDFEMLFAGSELSENMNWDNIITVLIIEIGPSELLSLIIDASEIIYNRIMENISLRMNRKDLKANYTKSYFEERNRICAIYRKDPFSNSVQRDRWLDEHKKDLMVKSIIRFVSMSMEDKYPPLVESLPMRLNHYKEICYSKKPLIKKIIEINYIYEKLFRFLNAFYTSLIAYAIEAGRLALKAEELKKANMLTQEYMPARIQEICEKQFLLAAENWVNEFNDQPKSIGVLLDEFRNLCKSTYSISNNDHVLMLNEAGNALESLIGRQEICNISKFDKIANDTKDQIGLSALINGIKHYKSERPTSEKIIDNFYERGIQLFYLLNYNEDSAINKSINRTISISPVFPYVIQFAMNKYPKDGYSVNSYSMIGIDANVNDIKLLSSRIHEEKEDYYCIPNMSSSTSKWWIEPFIIKCSEFNEIIGRLKTKD